MLQIALHDFSEYGEIQIVNPDLRCNGIRNFCRVRSINLPASVRVKNFDNDHEQNDYK